MSDKKSVLRKSLLLILLCVLLTNFTTAQDQNDDAPIKIDTLLLTLPVVVSDKSGRNIAGLKRENFSIFENGEEQEIEYFFNEEAPMNVAILVDTSASTKEVLDKIQKSARNFIKLFRPEDRGIIVSFDYQASFLSDLTGDRKKLSKAIDQTEIANQTGSDMNAAILKVMNNYFNAVEGRKAIIVLTDGMVTRNQVSTQQIMDVLQKTDTLFYPIVFKTKFYSEARVKAAANKRKPVPIELLEILAQETAGKFYEKDAADLQDAFQNIAEELKNQYLLGFYPTNSEAEKSVGSIRIEVDRKELTVKPKKRWSSRKNR